MCRIFDLWAWPISSRSFDLDFENLVRSVMFSVLDRLFPYVPQIINTIRGCVACSVYNKILKFQIFANFPNFSPFTLKKKLQFCLHSFHIWHKSSLASEGVLHVMTSDLDLYFQGHSALTFKIVSAKIVSTVLDGFFPYLVQIITSMRRCVACDDLWPGPISSRSFDLVLTWDPTE